MIMNTSLLSALAALARRPLSTAVGTLFLLGSLACDCAATDLADLAGSDPKPKQVVGECKFTEGPAWSPTGFLLFTDIPNDRIMQVLPDGTNREFLKPSGEANGLFFDAQGRLYLCRGGARNIARMDNVVTKELTVLAAEYDGKPLNSPNDLVLDGHGGLYFTDPRYGKTDNVAQPVMGVYYIAASGKVTRIIEDLERPNGVILSPDGRSLYVAEPNRRELYRYEILAPGVVTAGRRIFIGDSKIDSSGPDGMTVDTQGNLYCTYAGIVVLTPDGQLIGRIDVPERPSNCAFGGSENKTLYITGRTSLYSLEMQIAGLPLPESGPAGGQKVSRQVLPQPRILPRHGAWPAPRVRTISASATGLFFVIPLQTTAFVEEKAAAEKPADKDAEAKTKKVQAGDISLNIPESWEFKESEREFRAGEISVPPVKEDKDKGEIVVYYFGKGGAGGVQANLDRWIGQFAVEGRGVKVFKGTSSQGDYTLVELTGTYNKPMGPPILRQSKPMPGWKVLAAVIETDNGPYFLKFDGPQKSVAAHATAFRKSFGYKPDSEKENKPADDKPTDKKE